MVAEDDLCGGDNFSCGVFGNENSRLGKVHDLVSGYLLLKRKGQAGNEVHNFA